MKKRIILVVALLLAVCFSAVACDGEFDQTPSGDALNSLELTVDNALLNQDENNIKTVTFQANVPNFDAQTMTIEWYVNGVLQNGNNTTSFSYLPKLAGTYTVYAKFIAGEQVLTSKQYKITVFGTTMNVHIDVKDSQNQESLLNQYVNDIRQITFVAEIDNLVGMSEQNAYQALVWYVDDKAVDSSKGQKEFTYTPANQEDTVDVYAMVEGKFKSNYERVFVKMGDIVITAEGSVAQSDASPSEVILKANTAGSAVGQTAQWYVNGIEVSSKSDLQTFAFTPSGNGVYAIQAVVGDITSHTMYVICGKEVKTETELRNALDSDTKAIVLGADITLAQKYSSTVALNIDRSVAIAGNGYTITANQKPSILVNINARDVVISNVKFVGAQKYPLQFYKAFNSYVENVVIETAGYAGMHLNRSQVVAKNIAILDSNYAGVELSHPDYNAENPQDFPTILTVLGDIDFSGKSINLDGKEYSAPAAPIYSQNNEKACIVRSSTFVEYVVSGIVGGEEMIIRRWCNDGCNIGWVIVPPSKTSYQVGEKLTMQDIALRAFVCDTTYIADYSFLLMAFDYDIVAKFELLDADGNVVKTMYSRAYELGTNELVFEDENGNKINGTLDDTKIAQVAITLGGAYVGKYSVNVLPKGTVVEDNDNIASGDLTGSGDVITSGDLQSGAQN